MNNKNSYILYTHSESTINTLGDFVANPLNLISVCYSWNLYDLLNYEDEFNEPNIKKIIKRYVNQEELNYGEIIKYYSAKIWFDNNIEFIKTMPFKVGTTICIPKNKVNAEVYSTLSNQIEPGLQTEAFLAKNYKDLLLDSNFRSINKNLKSEQLGEINKLYPDITVWIWCRSLFNGKEKVRINTELNGTIFNLTPFIRNINTNINSQIGNFSFELNNLICYYDENEGWQLKNLRETDKGYISKFSLDVIKNGEFKRNQFFFNTVISENDIVFIRFETLKNEIEIKTKLSSGEEIIQFDKDFNKNDFKSKIQQLNTDNRDLTNLATKFHIKNRVKNQDKLIISPEEIPGNIYDMIGLVDATMQSTEPTDMTFSVQGRDLKKLLIEDGCYFYPIEFIPGGIFSNEVEEDYLERIDGKLINLTQGVILKFIINNLAKIKICDESLFKPYKERISKTFRLDIQSRKEKNKIRQELFDFRKEILKLIHSSRKDDNLEESINLDDATFNRVKNFLFNGKKLNALTFDGIDFKWEDFNYSEGTENIKVKSDIMPESLGGYLYPEEYKRVKNPLPGGIPQVIQLPPVTLYLIKLFNIAYGAFNVNLNRLKAGDYDDNIDSEKDFKLLEYGIYQDIKKQTTKNVIVRDPKTGKIISSKSVNSWNTMKILTPISYLQLKEFLKKPPYYFYTIKWFNTNWYPLLSSETWFVKDKYGLLKSNGQVDWDKADDLLQTVEDLLTEIKGRTTIGTEAGYKINGLGDLYKKCYTALRNEIERRLRPVYGDNWKNQAAVTYKYKNIKLDKFYSDLTLKQKDILIKIWDFIKKEENTKEFVETYVEQELKGIWKIIKFVVDDVAEPEGSIKGANIGNRRICDSSIGNENGSLMNSIQKICQAPFVEFTCDTYGDQYYFLVYQPPYTESAWKNLMEICSSLEIKEADILSEKLQFNSDSSYSWYKIRSQNAITDLGGEGAVSAYLKAVHFKEYSDIWGEKPLEIVSNYLEYHSIIGDKSDLNISYMIRQHLYDLKYIVDINSYLPFTRKGTITINGDRRIKVGSIIHYNPTGEVFMVDSVTQNFQNSNSGIDRTTVLQVSRGMVKKYIDLYFHIIDTPINEYLFYNNNVGYYDWVKILYENWKVNKEIFRFLLLKKQFSNAEAPKINTFKFENPNPNPWWENLDKISNIR